MTQHKSLAISLLLFFAVTICQMPSMIKSGFFSSFETEVLLSFIVLSVVIFAVYKIFHANSAVYTVSFMASLLFGNFAQLMLYFTCNMDSDRTLKSVMDFMIYTLASFVGALVIFNVLDKIKKYSFLCLGLFAAVSLAFLGLTLFFGDADNGTSSTSKGFQPAILMMFVMLYAFSGATAGSNDIIKRWIYLSFFWIMMGVLVAKHETGIPVMTFGACIVMYFMFNKSNKEKWFIIANIVISVVGFVVLMAKNKDLRNDTITKFTERTDVNDQWLMAKANIQASSLFGSSTYDVFVAEASTDYSLNNAVHYWGYFFGILVFILFFLMTISSYNDILNISNDNIISNMRKLAFCAVAVVIVYNILDNLCGSPVIGVQMLCFGTSRSMAVLSGLLMGTITADTKKMNISVIGFLEKAGIITSV